MVVNIVTSIRNCSYHLYADDLQLYISGKPSDTIASVNDINADLDRIAAWSDRNCLVLNPSKSKYMVLGTKGQIHNTLEALASRNIAVMGEPMERVDRVRNLGILMDSQLRFEEHILNVTVVEPIILYAASVWAPATGKLKVQQQLNTVQRGFAQKNIKSYRTVSLSAALTLSGLLPLDMRVRENAQLYEAKRGKPQEILRGRKLERRVCYLQAPHPAKEIAVGFVCLENMQPENLQHHQVTGSCIFTDGSKIEGKVGAAISHWRSGSETRSKKFRLESYCTVFQAEMLALLKATELALKETETVVNIFSDSRSALELLGDSGSFNPLAHEIKNKITELRDRNMELRLFRVRAHIGVEGNERADSLAKEATLYKKSAPDYERCPLSIIKRQIRQETKKQWGKRYASSETATVTKLFLPETDDAYQMLKKLKLGATSVPHAVVAISRHSGSCVYYTDRREEDAIVDLIERAEAVSLPKP
ncbi:uncharacterized protein LOC113234606 [Hyposmocoma kahamanoa]|uniref:uncharacterized protein LOC113234606 n=1 Tax=Hyposmocoma kahamanoa TaxID=1477025 RepID=UPI000E6D75FF|nr:uncharacterized protein LOC113234606 [Hyposmocoma kahamanoa]